MGHHRGAEKAELLLAAARYLNETLELERVYDRFRELLAEPVPHNGVIVSSYDPGTGMISCDYAWVDGGKLDPSILPPVPLNRHGGGMQSRVIVSGEPLLVGDVPERVKDPDGCDVQICNGNGLAKQRKAGAANAKLSEPLPFEPTGWKTVLLDGATGHDANLSQIDGVVDFGPGEFFVTELIHGTAGHLDDSRS